MAISFVGSNANSAAAGGAVTVGLTGSPVAGDLILVCLVCADNDKLDHDLSLATAGFTEITDIFQPGPVDDCNLAVFRKFHNGTDTQVVSNAVGGTDAGNAMAVLILRGVDPSTPLDVAHAVSQGAGSDPNPPNIDFIDPNAWVVVCGGSGITGGGDFAPDAAYATNFVTASGSGAPTGTVGMGYISAPSDPVNPSAMTGTNGNANTSVIAVTLAIRAAVAAALVGRPHDELGRFWTTAVSEYGLYSAAGDRLSEVGHRLQAATQLAINLFHSGGSTTDQAVYTDTLPSVLDANTMYLVHFEHQRTDATDPVPPTSIVLSGITFQLIGAVGYNYVGPTRRAIGAYVGWGSAPSGTGMTITFPQARSGCIWHVLEVPTVPLQVPTKWNFSQHGGLLNGAELSTTLLEAGASTSRPIALVGMGSAASGADPRTGWTEIAETAITNQLLETQWRSDAMEDTATVTNNSGVQTAAGILVYELPTVLVGAVMKTAGDSAVGTESRQLTTPTSQSKSVSDSATTQRGGADEDTFFDVYGVDTYSDLFGGGLTDGGETSVLRAAMVASQTAVATDTSSVTQIGGVLKTASDSGTGVDTSALVIGGVTVTASDSGVGTDTSQLVTPVSKTVSDSGVASDAAVVVTPTAKTASDAGLGSDTASVAGTTQKAASDTGVGVDTALRDTGARTATDLGIAFDTATVVIPTPIVPIDTGTRLGEFAFALQSAFGTPAAAPTFALPLGMPDGNGLPGPEVEWESHFPARQSVALQEVRRQSVSWLSDITVPAFTKTLPTLLRGLLGAESVAGTLHTLEPQTSDLWLTFWSKRPGLFYERYDDGLLEGLRFDFASGMPLNLGVQARGRQPTYLPAPYTAGQTLDIRTGWLTYIGAEVRFDWSSGPPTVLRSETEEGQLYISRPATVHPSYRNVKPTWITRGNLSVELSVELVFREMTHYIASMYAGGTTPQNQTVYGSATLKFFERDALNGRYMYVTLPAVQWAVDPPQPLSQPQAGHVIVDAIGTAIVPASIGRSGHAITVQVDTP